MPTGYVSTYHKSGGLTFSDVKYDRVSAKIGQAETGDANTVYTINNYLQAETIFGKGDLLDSIKQYFEEFNLETNQKPVPLLCVRPDNDQPGVVNTPSLEGTGTGTPTIDGTPTGFRTVKLKFTKGGAHETAEYRKSTDGGVSYGVPIVTPVSGDPIALDVGVTATFEDDIVNAADTFIKGDIWTFEIEGPTPSTSSMLTAVKTIKREYDLYWFHVIHPADRAFCVSVNTILAEMETQHNLPTFAVLEAKGKTEAQTVDEYMLWLQSEFDPFESDRVCIVCAEGRYIQGGITAAGGYKTVKADSSKGVWKNAATMLTAKIAAGAPNVSAGYVQEMRSLTISEIRYWNEGYRNFMDTLHDMKLTVLKEYNDYEGVYIAKDRIKCGADSDFAELPERRRADKMQRLVYHNSLQFLNQDTNPDSGSGGIDYINAYVSGKISAEMQIPGSAEITKHELVFDPDKDFDRTGVLKVLLTMYVARRINAIEWTTTFALS